MAHILISEPHPDLKVLFEAVVRRTGHEPIGPGELENGDTPAVMILEPASVEGRAAAARLRGRFGDLPIICTSIYPPNSDTRALEPIAFLIKPFRLSELAGAIKVALASRSL